MAASIRSQGFSVEIAFGDRSLKGAMKGADKSGARYVLVIGDNEIGAASVELKRMSDGDVISVKMSELNTVLGA
jgi:histidyl-tRNA synthetase